VLRQCHNQLDHPRQDVCPLPKSLQKLYSLLLAAYLLARIEITNCLGKLNIRRKYSLRPRRLRDAYMRLQVPNSSLKLHYPCVLCVVVELYCVKLSIVLFVDFVLLGVLTIYILPIAIFFVKNRVFCVYYVHLQYCA
jgi:hypothetical protein